MKEEREKKYYERLDIPILSIDRIKKLIKDVILETLECWKQGREVQKTTFHIIGPAGVGKTDICRPHQLPAELRKETGQDWQSLIIKCPVLSRDDFLIPFPVKDNGETKFKMLYSDFVPLDEKSFGLFVIDEFGRGDHNLQQLMWQVQNECKIHLKDLPRGWFVIACDNPADREYSMDFLEDAAGLRRMLHIYVEVSAPAFLEYAKQRDFHPLVIQYIQAHPDHLYDFAAQRAGAVYANPASWERVSDILWMFDRRGIVSNLFDISNLLSGYLNVSMTRQFIDFVKKGEDILPKDIFMNYGKVRKRVLNLVQSKDNAALGNVMRAFLTYLSSERPDFKTKEKNISQFVTDVPADTAALIVTFADSLPKDSEAFKYLNALNAYMCKRDENYRKNFYQTMVDYGKAASGV